MEDVRVTRGGGVEVEVGVRAPGCCGRRLGVVVVRDDGEVEGEDSHVGCVLGGLWAC